MQVMVSALNISVIIFFIFTQVRVFIVNLQVVLFTVHNYFYCKIQVTVPVVAM